MQAKSIKKYTIQERLQNLRLKEQLTWEQLAESLGLTAAMLHHVRRGIRNLSEKARYRLERAEIDAGLRPPTSQGFPAIKLENLDLENGLKRLRAKLNTLNPQAQKRVLKAILQILDEAQKRPKAKPAV
jgi:transcriptional regulator with XRE-family HTH domain